MHRYIGICAGAFLAMYTRFPTLRLAPVSITSWKRAEGMPQVGQWWKEIGVHDEP